MNGLAELAAFAGVMALGQFSPGPDMVLLTRTALVHGGRAGALMAAGIASGLILHAVVAMGGASVLLTGTSMAAHGLRLAAAGYLGWLGLRLLWGVWRREAAGAVTERLAGRYFRRGFFCNVLNPKAALFFAAVAAPFLSPDHPGWWPIALGGVIVGQGFALWVGWAWALQWAPLKHGYQAAARWLDLAFGGVLLGLAVSVVAGC